MKPFSIRFLAEHLANIRTQSQSLFKQHIILFIVCVCVCVCRGGGGGIVKQCRSDAIEHDV